MTEELRAELQRVRDAERERAAAICERMVKGGGAWSESQRLCAHALLEAAKTIRSDYEVDDA
jgi:hypothetical protein